MKIAVYPGTFDPITNGHIDIVHRSLKIFDHVIILLAHNPHKVTTFSVVDRVMMLKTILPLFPQGKVSIDQTDGLTVQYAKIHQAVALVRGLRAVPDFEYEHEIYAGNQFINPDIEMVFFMAKNQNEFISSSMIKQLHQQGVDISNLVPAIVKTYLDQRHRK